MGIKKISEFPSIPSAPTTGDFVLVERGGAGYKTGPVVTLGDNQTITGTKTFSSTPTFSASSSTEGGQINLGKPSGSSLSGDVAIDILTNTLRIFEGGGTNRGIQIDLSNTRGSIGTRIAPAPDATSGLGQWGQISADSADLNLPDGGTWAYHARYINNTTGVAYSPFVTGVAAGETTILTATAGYTGLALIWRIA